MMEKKKTTPSTTLGTFPTALSKEYVNHLIDVYEAENIIAHYAKIFPEIDFNPVMNETREYRVSRPGYEPLTKIVRWKISQYLAMDERRSK